MKKKRNGKELNRLAIIFSFIIAAVISILSIIFVIRNWSHDEVFGEIVFIVFLFTLSFFFSYLYFYDTFNIYEERFKDNKYEKLKELRKYLSQEEYKEVYFKYPIDVDENFSSIIKSYKARFYAKIVDIGTIYTIDVIAKDLDGNTIYNEKISNINYFLSIFSLDNLK